MCFIYMEDLLYLKKHGVKNSYTFLVDSSKRDVASYPNSSEYVVEFNSPFRKVLGLELLDAHIPRTELAVTADSNTFVYKVDGSVKRVATLTPGSYSTAASLLTALHDTLTDGLDVNLSPTGYAVFSTGSAEFTLYASESTLTPTLGFISTSRTVSSSSASYTPPAMIDVSGPRYLIVRCPEIETLVQHDRHFERWNPGVGIVKFPVHGQQSAAPPEYIPLPLQSALTPLARLGSITIRLEKPNGQLYNTGNLDHALVLRIHWLDAPDMGLDSATYTSQLNPQYSLDTLASTSNQGREQPGRDERNGQGGRDNANLNWRHTIFGSGDGG